MAQGKRDPRPHQVQLGAPWREATYRDTYKFGGPETDVSGEPFWAPGFPPAAARAI